MNKNCILFILFINIWSTLYSQNNVTLHANMLDTSGREDCSMLLQNSINNLSRRGGGKLKLPKGTFCFRYTVFIPSKIKIEGQGKQTIILANISISEGRCAFLVGDSYEVNYAKTQEYRKKNVRGWLANSSFKDIENGMDLQVSDKRIITRNSSVENLLIRFDYNGCGSNWGGYGIQFANAANCYAKNIWTENACQAVGIGSDTKPALFPCVKVYCYNIHVIRPDPIHTYYAIGFISYSNHCGIINADSDCPMTNESEDGSLIAMNMAQSCEIRNIKGIVGHSKTSEGLLLNNSFGCNVSNITISDAYNGISISFTDYDMLLNRQRYRNTLDCLYINNCYNAINLLSKSTDFRNVFIKNCKKIISYNVNATNNTFKNFSYIESMDLKSKSWLKTHNTFLN